MFRDAVYLPECLDEFINISRVFNVQKNPPLIFLPYDFFTCVPTFAHSEQHSFSFSSNINAIAAVF
jgi:hypothetical protein